MYKKVVESPSNIRRSKRIIFDKKDIEFIEGEGAFLTLKELVSHLKIHLQTFYRSCVRQPEVLKAREKAKQKQIDMYKEKITPKYLGGAERTIFEEEDIKKVEELAAFLTTTQIADYFGLSDKAFLDIRKRQENVHIAYQKGRAKKIIKFAEHLEQKALGETIKGDSACLMFFLKTQGRWAEVREEIINATTETEEERLERIRRTKLFMLWEKEYEKNKLNKS